MYEIRILPFLGVGEEEKVGATETFTEALAAAALLANDRGIELVPIGDVRWCLATKKAKALQAWKMAKGHNLERPILLIREEVAA